MVLQFVGPKGQAGVQYRNSSLPSSGGAALTGGGHVLALVLDACQASILRLQEFLVGPECTPTAPAVTTASIVSGV